MKLRNKKTGEIMNVTMMASYNGGELKIRYFPVNNADDTKFKEYHSISELNDEWEDYEEPKDTSYWCIDSLGKIEFHSTVLDEIDGTPNNAMVRKIIGNYFDTREEARQAVEKIKALTEAKEDGLKIKGYYYNHEDLVILADIGKCNKLTLDTLFGKEID